MPGSLSPCWSVIVPGAEILKVPPLAVPLPLFRLMDPVTAPGITIAVIRVLELETISAGTPPMVKLTGLSRLVPFRLTSEPTGPESGLTEVMVGWDEKLYTKPTLLPLPPAVVTDTEPLAPLFTIALILVPLSTVNSCAATPPKLTAVAPVKLLPSITISTPSLAVEGLKLLTSGAAGTKPKNHTAPFSLLSPGPPMVSVCASALRLSERPWADVPDAPLPENFPC